MVVKEAFKEACTRYPDSVSALVWFATASGLFDGVLTSEHLAWANRVMTKNSGAAIFNDYSSPLDGTQVYETS